MQTAKFTRKAESINELIPLSTFTIEATVTLSASQFDHFKKNLLRDYSFIEEHAERMYQDNDGVMHCIFVTAEESPYGILVESEGYNYARYSAYLEKKDLPK